MSLQQKGQQYQCFLLVIIPPQGSENVFSVFCILKNVKRMLHQKMSFHGKMERKDHLVEEA